MANSKNIKGNADGKNRENQSYTIKGRGKVSRATLVKEVENNKHERCGIYKREGVKYVRALRDNLINNNIDNG